jgi:hypothetical protein
MFFGLHHCSVANNVAVYFVFLVVHTKVIIWCYVSIIQNYAKNIKKIYVKM